MVFSGCTTDQKEAPARKEAPVALKADDTPETSELKKNKNPISEDNLPETDSTVSIEDYWEEASSIKSEAIEILSSADQVQCTEARTFAQKALSYSAEASQAEDFFKAEHFVEVASQALIEAEDAITYCEEYSEESFDQVKN